jgi:hypothetical protein
MNKDFEYNPKKIHKCNININNSEYYDENGKTITTGISA